VTQICVSTASHKPYTFKPMNNLDTTNKLIKMVTQISTFFESFPDREEALDGIANHLKKFWTPAMRANLIDEIDANTVTEQHQIVTQAIHKHRANLLSGVATSHSSAEKQSAQH